MDSLWNKIGISTYKIAINYVLVTIYSHSSKLHFAPYPKQQIKRHITIWFDEEVNESCKNKFYQATKRRDLFIPQPIQDAYRYLGLGVDKMKEHINQYAEWDEVVYAHYAYPADDFYVAYHLHDEVIYLWGNKANLERILISILSITGDSLPLHAACLSYHDKGFMIIGDSSSGKTSIALMLIEQGATYIADDVLYVDRNLIGHRCCEYMLVRKECIHERFSNYVEFTKGDRCFLNLNVMRANNVVKVGDATRIDKIIFIEPLNAKNMICTKLFCTFKHDSMMGLDFLHDHTQTICNLLDNSLTEWNIWQSRLSVASLSIDYSDFEKSLRNELNKIFN